MEIPRVNWISSLQWRRKPNGIFLLKLEIGISFLRFSLSPAVEKTGRSSSPGSSEKAPGATAESPSPARGRAEDDDKTWMWNFSWWTSTATGRLFRAEDAYWEIEFFVFGISAIGSASPPFSRILLTKSNRGSGRNGRFALGGGDSAPGKAQLVRGNYVYIRTETSVQVSAREGTSQCLAETGEIFAAQFSRIRLRIRIFRLGNFPVALIIDKPAGQSVENFSVFNWANRRCSQSSGSHQSAKSTRHSKPADRKPLGTGFKANCACGMQIFSLYYLHSSRFDESPSR